VLPGGELGVEETCSGVKALTALTAMAAFIAFVRRFGLVRGGLLVVAAVPVVVAVNVLRVTLSGVIQEAAGTEYIRGGWHDALGFGTVLVGLGGILVLAKLISPRSTTTATPTPTHTPFPAPTPWPASLLLGCSLVATLAVVWHGRTLVPPPVPLPPLEELPTQLGDWTEHQRPPVPPHVTDLLQPDAMLHREYRNPLGRSATVWVIYWTSAHAVRGYHHPDVCLPNVGYKATARGVVSVTPTGGGELPLTARTLSGQGGELYVLYWTQTGQRVWGPADEQEAQDNLQFGRLLGRAAEQWTDPTPPQPAGRLVVLIGSPQPTAFGRAEVEAFARLVADEVYRLCPSAAQPIAPDR
jgi:EpsI family protein